MVQSPPTLSKDISITNELGLHARAAAQIAKVAADASVNVWIAKNGNRVDASSIIDILTLSCAKGSLITISVDSPVDAGILDAIVKMVASGFGE